MKCPNCGVEVKAGETFCPNCGTKIEDNAELNNNVNNTTTNPPKKKKNYWWIPVLLFSSLFIFLMLNIFLKIYIEAQNLELTNRALYNILMGVKRCIGILQFTLPLLGFPSIALVVFLNNK